MYLNVFFIPWFSIKPWKVKSYIQHRTFREVRISSNMKLGPLYCYLSNLKKREIACVRSTYA